MGTAEHVMSAESAIDLLDRLADQRVDACVGGGWAVDALLGEQTREHSDLDLWLAAADLEPLFVAFAACGVDRVLPWPGDRPWNFVLHDGARLRVDLHLYEPLSRDSLHYGSVTSGEAFPAAALQGAASSPAGPCGATPLGGRCAGTAATRCVLSTGTM